MYSSPKICLTHYYSARREKKAFLILSKNTLSYT